MAARRSRNKGLSGPRTPQKTIDEFIDNVGKEKPSQQNGEGSKSAIGVILVAGIIFVGAFLALLSYFGVLDIY